MNYLIEGLQGSGKSTLVQRLSERYTQMKPVREGDYSPIELAWCAYLDDKQFAGIMNKYESIRDDILAKTHIEGDHRIVCYTQIITDIPGFHKELEQYEIYNGNIALCEFEQIVLSRFAKWNSENGIFECSIFQNIVEDLLLFRKFSEDEIIDFYNKVHEVLADKEYQILYLECPDVSKSIAHIRRERSDEKGNELWFPMMLRYFESSPYALHNGLVGEAELVRHFEERQAIELRLCKEVFGDRARILTSKKVNEYDI